jgi:hypothetical protein
MTKKINETPKEFEKEASKVIVEAIKKNENSLLDVERIIKNYIQIANIINIDMGLIGLSIIRSSSKLLKDKEFIEWCVENIKEEKDV